MVAGNVLETITVPDGSPSSVELPQRWVRAVPAGWWRQRLTLPAGATSGHVNGLTDAGEAGGSVTLDATRAVRWSLDGRSSTLLSADPSAVTAVGPDGPWAVTTVDPEIPVQGDTELVSRDGVRTPLRGTPDLDTGYRHTAGSVGGGALSLRDDGARTRLSAPAGWSVTSVVELTDTGLLVADVRNADGVVRPAAWNLGGRPRES
ncbi:hypothetical protein AB0F72_22480 [Actinoplanes sp. NPDC023936]|uniref:hypothetical protein n=1 Tax=Actinoplanes sp. NPDC023936 TaxID=3154910 RepID=UPI0033F80AB6